MLDMRFGGLPHFLTAPAAFPAAVNANHGSRPAGELGVPDFPVAGLFWAPPQVWRPMYPSSPRNHLTVVK